MSTLNYYKSSLGIFQYANIETKCKKEDTIINKLVKFECEFNPEKKEIESLEVEGEDFEFEEQEVYIKACTPKAVKDMKNIILIGDNEISDKKLYILQSAEQKIEDEFIKIEGQINDKSFKGEHLVLTILSSDKGTEEEINCDIKPLKSKYKFSCTLKNEFEGELDGATGKLDDEILVVNFKKVKDSFIKFEKSTPPKKSFQESNEEFNLDDLKGPGMFTINLLIYLIIIIIIILFFFIIYVLSCKIRKPIRLDKQMDESNSITSDINS